MYNLSESHLLRIQNALLSYYKTEKEDTFKPEIRLNKAVEIVDRIIDIEAKNLSTIDKSMLVDYLQGRLVIEKKLKTTNHMMYRTVN